MNFSQLKETATNNPYVTWGVAICVALGISFMAGRMSAPEKVTTQEIVKTDTKTSTNESIDTKKVDTTAKKVDTVTTTTETVKPDGTKVIQTVVVDKTVENTGSTEVTDDNKKTAAETQTSKTDTKIVDNGKKWHLSVMAGTSPTAMYDATTQWAKPAMSYGGSVEYRVIGDIYAGAFGLSSGLFGVSLGLSM